VKRKNQRLIDKKHRRNKDKTSSGDVVAWVMFVNFDTKMWVLGENKKRNLVFLVNTFVNGFV
jgi:hypothetical protein